MEPLFTGALEDARPLEQQAKNYLPDEILGMGMINWTEKPESLWTKLSKRNQAYSFSCGGHAGAKAMEYLTGIPMSARGIYPRRSNFPKGGMALWEIGDILKKHGTTLEVELPSNNLSEEQMNAPVTVDTPYKIGGYYFPRIGKDLDMDVLATAMESGHPLIIAIEANHEEYNEVPTTNDKASTFRHFTANIPTNYKLHNGEKSLVIDDSSSLESTIDQEGQRIFTESWLKKHCWGILALIPLKAVEKPHFVFTRNMRKGYFGEDVKQLQQALAHLGYFPTTQVFTKYFGQISEAAVKKFQTANNLLSDGIIGPKSLLVLNNLMK